MFLNIPSIITNDIEDIIEEREKALDYLYTYCELDNQVQKLTSELTQAIEIAKLIDSNFELDNVSKEALNQHMSNFQYIENCSLENMLTSAVDSLKKFIRWVIDKIKAFWNWIKNFFKRLFGIEKKNENDIKKTNEKVTEIIKTAEKDIEQEVKNKTIKVKISEQKTITTKDLIKEVIEKYKTQLFLIQLYWFPYFVKEPKSVEYIKNEINKFNNKIKSFDKINTDILVENLAELLQMFSDAKYAKKFDDCLIAHVPDYISEHNKEHASAIFSLKHFTCEDLIKVMPSYANAEIQLPVTLNLKSNIDINSIYQYLQEIYDFFTNYINFLSKVSINNKEDITNVLQEITKTFVNDKEVINKFFNSISNKTISDLTKISDLITEQPSIITVSYFLSIIDLNKEINEALRFDFKFDKLIENSNEHINKIASQIQKIKEDNDKNVVYNSLDLMKNIHGIINDLIVFTRTIALFVTKINKEVISQYSKIFGTIKTLKAFYNVKNNKIFLTIKDADTKGFR